MKSLCCIIFPAVLFLSACAGVSTGPLTRGVHGPDVFSSSRPPMTVSCSLPVLASFQGRPLITTEASPTDPETWGVVYGGDGRLAIAAMAEAPQGWEWRFPPQVVGGRRAEDVRLDTRVFSGQTLLVPARKDPFSRLAFEGGIPDVCWLTRQFTQLEDFQTFKVILEYRELLTEDPLESPLDGRELAAFEQRAREAFSVTGLKDAGVRDDVWMDSVDSRYFTRFLGRLGLKDEHFGPSW